MSSGNNETKSFYINPVKMREVWEASKLKGECSPELLLYFQKISFHFSKVFWYSNTCDKDSCINFAVACAWQKWDKFDSERCENIFAFFTTMIANDMRQEWNSMTRNRDKQISIDALLATVKR